MCRGGGHGGAAHLGAGYLDYRQPEIKAHFERIYGTGIPTQPGLKIPQMFDAARAGKLKALWIMGEDILQTDPNSCEVKYSLGMISLVDLEWSYFCGYR